MPAKDNRPIDESSAPGWTGTVTHAPEAEAMAREVTLADVAARPTSEGATSIGRQMAERTDLDPRRDAFPGYRLRPGMRFGPCITVKPLGRGGMGEVWLSMNDAEQREEAVKVLLDANARDDELRRFIREAQASMSLSGAREVVRTYGVDVEQGLLYIRMELVRGHTLDVWQPKDGRELFQVMKRMAAALAVGHRKSLVHRDVKPSNYMVREDGTVKLMDFGLARPLGVTTLTATSAMMGTPAYMAPEQWVDARSVDMRADVYSLGVAYYALVTKRLPYDSASCATPQAYHLKVVNEDPAPPVPQAGMPVAVSGLILKAMAKRPEDRYADAVELLEALEKIEREPAVRVAPPRTEASRRRARVLKAVALFTVAILITVGGTAAGVSWVVGRGSGSALPPSPFAAPGSGRGSEAIAGEDPARVSEVSAKAKAAELLISSGPERVDPAQIEKDYLRSANQKLVASLDREAVKQAALSSRISFLLQAGRAADEAVPRRIPEALRSYRGAVAEFMLLSLEERAIYEEVLGVKYADLRARVEALRAVAVADEVERASAASSRPVPASTGEFGPPPGAGGAGPGGPAPGGPSDGARPQPGAGTPPPPMGPPPGGPGGRPGGPGGPGGRGPR